MVNSGVIGWNGLNKKTCECVVRAWWRTTRSARLGERSTANAVTERTGARDVPREIQKGLVKSFANVCSLHVNGLRLATYLLLWLYV